jgi:hypothetical protein
VLDLAVLTQEGVLGMGFATLHLLCSGTMEKFPDTKTVVVADDVGAPVKRSLGIPSHGTVYVVFGPKLWIVSKASVPDHQFL